MGLRNKIRIGRKSAPPMGTSDYQMVLTGNLRDILEQIASGGDTGLALANNYRAQLLDGYAANPYVAKCVHLRASQVSSLRPVLFDKDDNEITDHRVPQIFRRPNSEYSWKQMIYEVASDVAMSGNGFFEPIKTVKGVSEIWYVRAGDVTPMPRTDRYHPVGAWQVSSHGQTAMLEPDRLIHIVGGKKGPDDILAIAPLASARLSVEQQTSARKWNVALMKNGAKPSVVIQDQHTMTDGQFSTLMERLKGNHAGTNNAGSVMVLDGGKTISTAGFNARDMDYAVGVTTSAKEIAIALQVPPELVGDSANKTYSNAAEANREFALQTVVPDADRIYDALTRYLCVGDLEGYRIGYDRSAIEALRDNEVELMTALQTCSFLTVNEKRSRLSYDKVDAGNKILVPMGEIPLDEAVSPVEMLPASPPVLPDEDDSGTM